MSSSVRSLPLLEFCPGAAVNYLDAGGDRKIAKFIVDRQSRGPEPFLTKAA